MPPDPFAATRPAWPLAAYPGADWCAPPEVVAARKARQRDRDAAEKAELDEWRATYGRLDIPVTVIDWRPVYAGAAALGIALVARWVVRHGRRGANPWLT